MKLNEEERSLIVKMQAGKSEKLLGEIDDLISLKYWDTTMNRLYYALFHAASALLISDGHTVRTHQGISMVLGEHYVKAGLLSAEEGHLYARIQNLRERSDYNCSFNVTEDDVLPLIAPIRLLASHLIALSQRDR